MLKGVETRAEANLNEVEKAFITLYGDKFSSSDKDALKRTIYVEKLHNLTEVGFKYIPENRFWAISFNMEYSTIIKGTIKEKELGDNSMIKERIESLDATKLKTECLEDGFLRISFQSLVGSSTWLFIPPVMQLIKPKDKEIAEITELLMLISASII